MLSFPSSTEVNKRIPKQRFYEHVSITPAVKRLFVEQVDSIYWLNKISTITTNLQPGSGVTEVEIFELRLNSPELDEAVLRVIDGGIPYHILFLLRYGEQCQLCTAYKEITGGKVSLRRYYRGPWQSAEALSLRLEGATTDEVYENLVRSVAGGGLQEKREGENFAQAVSREEKRAALQKKLDKLERMTRKEIQPKKKFELYQQVQAIKKEIEAIHNS